MDEQERRERKKLLLIFFLFIALLSIYQFLKKKNIEREGRYTKATVINSEGYKGGIGITLSYKYQNKDFEGLVNSDLGKAAIGRQYFIQLKPDDPKWIVFHRDQPVPDCLTNVEAPPEGWAKIPGCP